MASSQIGVIRISQRVVQMGYQVYPLANISRVQSLQTVWRGKTATFYPLREIVVWLLALVAIVVVFREVVPIIDVEVGFDLHQAARPIVAVVGLLVWARVVYLIVLVLYRLLIRQPWYMLVIETAGTQYTALSGADHREISRIRDEIVSAIETPPISPRDVQVHGDVVLGDKFGGNRIGRDNIVHN